MRPFELFFVASLAFVSGCATNAPQQAASASPPKSACEQTSIAYDTSEFTCPLKSSRSAALYRFKVTFGGVHDDTKVRMEPTLNEQLLTCAEGSKTDFIGDEVGTSSLECRFSLPADAPAQTVLKVRMQWTHGNFAGVELIREQA